MGGELGKYGHLQPYCSGMVGFPITEFGLQFIKEWKAMFEPSVPRTKNDDQPALNALIARKYLDKVEFIDGCFHEKGKIHKSLLVHFKSKYKRIVGKYCSKMIRKVKS